MELKDFTTDALRTESVVETIEANKELLENLLNAYVGIGNMIDQIKKNAFYGKEFDGSNMAHNYYSTLASVKFIEGLDANDKETIDVDPRIFHGIVGTATESTEMVEALMLRLAGADIDLVNVGEEVGDVMWYLAILMDSTGHDWDITLETVIAKLKERYPKKFTSDSAINRDLDNERQILESGFNDNNT